MATTNTWSMLSYIATYESQVLLWVCCPAVSSHRWHSASSPIVLKGANQKVKTFYLLSFRLWCSDEKQQAMCCGCYCILTSCMNSAFILSEERINFKYTYPLYCRYWKGMRIGIDFHIFVVFSHFSRRWRHSWRNWQRCSTLETQTTRLSRGLLLSSSSWQENSMWDEQLTFTIHTRCVISKDSNSCNNCFSV